VKEDNRHLPDLYPREWAYFLPLVILAFWIGIYPKPFLSYFEKPVAVVVEQVRPGYAKGLLERAGQEGNPPGHPAPSSGRGGTPSGRASTSHELSAR
jgi:NADH-quinone oxidoreductase subunit M